MYLEWKSHASITLQHIQNKLISELTHEDEIKALQEAFSSFAIRPCEFGSCMEIEWSLDAEVYNVFEDCELFIYNRQIYIYSVCILYPLLFNTYIIFLMGNTCI